MRLKTYFKTRGTQAKLARDFGVSRQFIGQVAHGSRPVPEYMYSKIEAMTGGKVTPRELSRHR